MDMKNYRDKIDAIDNQLVELFCERMALSAEISAYKEENHLPILSKPREREVLHNAVARAGIYGEYVQTLYNNIFEMSRALQRTLQQQGDELGITISESLKNTPDLFPQSALIACQGTEGAYSQQACDKLFPAGNILYFRDFEGVFNAVEQGMCRYGILPIENSIHGTVNEVYDLMRTHKFYIVRSIRLKIDHTLLVKPGTKLENIKRIYSHEQALGQCSDFLKGLEGIEVIPAMNTAMAAEAVANSETGDMAAICSRECAALYGLDVIKENIQNAAVNETRFICISKELEIYPGATKISLMVTLPHEPGSLFNLLAKFSSLGINLTKLENRTLPGRDFAMMFYFDFDASVNSKEVIPLLSEVAAGSESFAFLGNYSEV